MKFATNLVLVYQKRSVNEWFTKRFPEAVKYILDSVRLNRLV